METKGCKKCKVCAHAAVMAAFPTGYPEDKDGVPYCDSRGPLSDKNREILSRKFFELKSVPAPRTGPYA